jgi:predicted site-specific integrase-resolvase
VQGNAASMLTTKIMKTILDTVIENRKGHYVHALEVESTYEIEEVISAIADEFSSHGIEALKEFFNSMAIYYIGDDEETEKQVYAFNIDEYIDTNISL